MRQLLGDPQGWLRLLHRLRRSGNLRLTAHPPEARTMKREGAHRTPDRRLRALRGASSAHPPPPTAHPTAGGFPGRFITVHKFSTSAELQEPQALRAAGFAR